MLVTTIPRVSWCVVIVLVTAGGFVLSQWNNLVSAIHDRGHGSSPCWGGISDYPWVVGILGVGIIVLFVVEDPPGLSSPQRPASCILFLVLRFVLGVMVALIVIVTASILWGGENDVRFLACSLVKVVPNAGE